MSNKKNKKIIYIFINIIFPIIIGGIIYIGYRPINLILFSWFEPFKNIIILPIRDIFSQINLSNWIIYSLPHALWAYSLTITLLYIWKDSTIKNKLLIVGIILIIVLGGEISQLIGISSGTFCWIDIMLSTLFVGLGIIITKLKGNFKNEKIKN